MPSIGAELAEHHEFKMAKIVPTELLEFWCQTEIETVALSESQIGTFRLR